MGEVADMATSAMTKTAAGAPRHPHLLPEAGPVCPSASCPPAPPLPVCALGLWGAGGPAGREGRGRERLLEGEPRAPGPRKNVAN